MIDTKKEQEQTALHSTIWRIANDLRGSVDGWDFKQYILGILFYRFISENLSSYIEKNQKEAGENDFIYSHIGDDVATKAKKNTIDVKGFFILPSQLFENVRKNAKNNPNLNTTLLGIFESIEGASVGTKCELAMRGLFSDIDVKSNKLGATLSERNGKLVKILNAIGDLNFGNYEDNSIDLFGDAYEYLMTMYSAEAGKSGGEFFTPQEVSELLASITIGDKKEIDKVYDPACGSGSLLLKFAKVLGKENVKEGFFGQESNITTYNLCRINMFLHDIDYTKFDIAHGDTLMGPQKNHLEKTFEAIVSNPPYSIKWEGDANPLLINDERFSSAGVLAPKSKADLAFIMHCLSLLAPKGTAAIVCFPGVMYRGGAEQKIRKYIIDNSYVDAVIQLAPDLFFSEFHFWE